MKALFLILCAILLSTSVYAENKPVVSNAENESNSGSAGRNNYSIQIDSEGGGGISVNFGSKKPKTNLPTPIDDEIGEIIKTQPENWQ